MLCVKGCAMVTAQFNLVVLARYPPGDTCPTVLTMFPIVTISYTSIYFGNCIHAKHSFVRMMSINVGAEFPFR